MKNLVQLLRARFLLLTTLLFFGTALSNAEDRKEVTFGALGVFTGDMSFLGEVCRNGMELAREDLNAQGGMSNLPLRIIYEDFGPFDLKKAASGGQKLISVDKVSALFPAFLEDTEILAPIAAKARVPVMVSNAGGVNIGKYGKNVFRATTTDLVLLNAYFNYLKSRGFDRVLLLGVETAYFESMAIAAQAEAPKHNIKLEISRVLQAESDFKALSAQFKKSDKQAVIALLMPSQFTAFLRAFRSLGNKTLVLGAPYYDYEELKKETASVLGNLVFARYSLPIDSFSKRYAARFGREAMRPAGNCYDAVRVMAKVIDEARGDFDTVNKTLHGLKNYQGVTGEFTVGDQGDRYGEKLELFQVQENTLTLIDVSSHLGQPYTK